MALLPSPSSRSRAAASLILALLGATVDARAGAGSDPEPVAFRVEETLSRPTTDGLTLSLIPDEDAELLLEIDGPGAAGLRLGPHVFAAGDLATFVVRGLDAGTSYAYRVLARRPGEAAFLAREGSSFRTLAARGRPTGFAFIPDSHVYAVWAKSECSPIVGPPVESNDLKRFKTTMDNVAADPLVDFVVLGGDNAMTQCGKGCSQCDVDGQNAGSYSVANQLQADLRYRRTYQPDLLGRLTRHRPTNVVLGNHDGEIGFLDADGSCNIDDQVFVLSQSARLGTLPNPAAVYRERGGDLAGGHYAFASGEVLLVVLDIMATTPLYPQTADDWTLGAAQLQWLDDVLRESDHAYKVVFAEHLVGGVKPPDHCYWYGRGGLNATDTGTPTGTFLGEQALVHEILAAHGAQLFFQSHDHVVAWGEKPDAKGAGEGVIYMTGGQPSATSPPWADETWFAEEMDYDGDLVPEYQTDVTGTEMRGYVRMRADTEEAWVEYVGTAVNDPELNGLAVLGFNVPAGGLLGLGARPTLAFDVDDDGISIVIADDDGWPDLRDGRVDVRLDGRAVPLAALLAGGRVSRVADRGVEVRLPGLVAAGPTHVDADSVSEPAAHRLSVRVRDRHGLAIEGSVGLR